MSILIDTLKLANRLEEAGFSRDQAAGTAHALSDAFGADLATKSDLHTEIVGLRSELKAEIAELRTELKTGLAETRAELKSDIAALRASPATWIISAVMFNSVLLVGALATFYSLLRTAMVAHP